jgi:hypothetical protein
MPAGITETQNIDLCAVGTTLKVISNCSSVLSLTPITITIIISPNKHLSDIFRDETYLMTATVINSINVNFLAKPTLLSRNIYIPEKVL